MAESLSSILIIYLICVAFLGISATAARNGLKKPFSYFALDATTSGKDDASSFSGSNFTYVCDPSRYAALGLDMANFVFCDKSLPYDVRARDLVNHMTLQEKVQQLGHGAYGVPRLGLPKYNWWSEALHGVSSVGPGTFFDEVVPAATSFPTVILTTASFNESLWKTIGQAISTEARAMYNLGRAGLTFWSPVINVVRDPRWGRTIETNGEDPFIIGRYASSFVRGLQDVEGTENYPNPDSRPLKVSSCCKHFTAYDVDNWNNIIRETFDARVTEQDMVETFNRPFEMCIKEGDVSSIMCSYNRVNGIPACADPKLLNQTIRGEWNLHGYIVSDCDSIQVMVERHKFLGDTKEDAVARTLKAGLDLDCGKYYTQNTESSVKQGKVREEDIDRSLKYLYVVLLRLGFFDGSPQFQSLGLKDVCSEQHIELAAQAAREGIVLLKNKDDTLPLKSDTIKTLAVVGPHANATNAMIGNYAGIPCRYISPIDGFSTYAKVSHAIGCDVACKDDNSVLPAVEVAQEADATIIVAGIDLSVEAESNDREDLLLPGYQTELINNVANAAKGPVILVIMSAGGIDITFAKNNDNIKAILWAGYPGEEGGRAIADVVFGKYNPGGRLPLTWHEADYVNQLPMTSLQLRPNDELRYPGRTYKFFNGSTVYPFGYGLSYTNFTYKLTSPRKSVDIKLNKFQHCYNLNYKEDTSTPPCPSVRTNHLSCKEIFQFDVEVKNVGSRDGSEVMIVYSKPPEGIVGANIKQVIGFKRLFVNAKSSQKVSFEFNICKSLQIIDYNAYSVLPSGGHTIMIGDDVISFPIQISFS
ncbi:probable beta-D-xylosidase 5 [Jatropha curcas]|uniref:probable beta-D-xylosidase 5 n=1 Tax=Jatropha curcas TaxID=180498 RepID=UPI0018944714|nr:probable beta-D-xylosidase 5 [Jatropha curcas]